MKTLEEIKQWLVQHKSVLQERYQVRELGIFGSYVRQEQTETSDVDMLVEFSEIPSLLKFVNLENYLSDNLGVKLVLLFGLDTQFTILRLREKKSRRSFRKGQNRDPLF